MKYVLDASVAVKWFLPEADSRLALALRDDFQRQIHELIAPDIFPIEIAHALIRAERKGIVTHDDAVIKLVDAFTVAPILHPHLPLLPRALEIAASFRIGVFDCLYVALAERENCQLVTADERMTKTLTGFPIVLFSAV
jgi:predicted nucleic acid-binding protein